jgi:hypothetical protein
VSWPSYRANPARLALVIGGIAAGVSLFAAIGLINASVLANFRNMLERTAGKAALQIELGTGEIGFDESVLETIGKVDGVANAFGMVRGTLHEVRPGDDKSDQPTSRVALQLFGVDLGSDAIESYDVRIVGGASPFVSSSKPDPDW